MTLDDGFVHAKLVNAAADRLDRLIHRPVFKLLQRLRPEGDRPVIFSSRARVVIRKLGLHRLLQLRTRRGSNTFNDNLLRMIIRVWLGDFAIGDLGRLERGFQALHRVVGFEVDGVVDLHLQNQMRTALEIEPQVDAMPHGRWRDQRVSQRIPGETRRDAKDAIDKDQHRRDNDDDFPGQILIHD